MVKPVVKPVVKSVVKPVVKPDKQGPGRPEGWRKWQSNDAKHGRQQPLLSDMFDPGRAERERTQQSQAVFTNIITGIVDSVADVIANEWEVSTRWQRTPGCCPMCNEAVVANRDRTDRACKRKVLSTCDTGLFIRGLCDWPCFGWCYEEECSGFSEQPTPRKTCDHCFWVCARCRLRWSH